MRGNSRVGFVERLLHVMPRSRSAAGGCTEMVILIWTRTSRKTSVGLAQRPSVCRLSGKESAKLKQPLHPPLVPLSSSSFLASAHASCISHPLFLFFWPQHLLRLFAPGPIPLSLARGHALKLQRFLPSSLISSLLISALPFSHLSFALSSSLSRLKL